MKVCVTGGAGFIGSNLVSRLVRDGHEVTVLDNLSTGLRENLADVDQDVRLVVGDLRDMEAVRDALGGVEVVFHQAALASVQRSVERPDEVTDVNVGGTLNVLVAARDQGVRRVVFASSSSVYGDAPTLPKVESMPIQALSPYAASKAAGEAYLASFYASYGLETVSLRYFNVFGPRQRPDSQYAAVIPLFVDAMRQGESPVIFGDGEQTRDFTYVGDVVEALWCAAVAPGQPEGPVNIGGGGNRVSINDLARGIAKAIGFEGEPTYKEARVGDVKHSLADITRATTWMGWQPKTALQEGIEKTVASFGVDVVSARTKA
ncbi:MAG: SDR family oxidoreductase [Planctomycetota bacterium]|nr:SDR family oxidoreductase [Planctomycetota bacterium]